MNALKCTFEFINCAKYQINLNQLNRSANFIFSNNQKIRNRYLHQTYQLENSFLPTIDDIRLQLKSLTYSGSKLQCASVYLLGAAVDQIDYLEWFRYFEMQDTISSWFQITMLHVWMILIRISDSSQESTYFKREIIKRMWEDFSVRVNKLGYFPAKVKRNFTQDCSLVFNAAIVAYDEGLIGSDRELAASLWRTFFAYNCNDYTKLEILVNYVRTQIQHLSSLSNDEIRAEKQIKWKKFNFS